MKKAFITVFSLMLLSFNLLAQRPGEDNGFGLRMHIGIPSSNYACNGKVEDGGVTYKTTYKGAVFGLDLDNRWYVWHSEKMGVAVQAHWLDFSVGIGTYKDKSSTDNTEYRSALIFEYGLMGVGPIFTYYIGHDMAVDGYYNIVPTSVYVYADAPEYYDVYNNHNYYDNDVSIEGFTLTHNFGVAFRCKVLQSGLEYRLGKMEFEDSDKDGLSYNAYANSLKLFFGFKF